jgi:molybdopterin adenylyltransferase
VPDDLDTIAAALHDLTGEGCCLIVTTGGTGPAPRDVTPEATEQVCTRMLPGFGELMRQESLKYVPTAILSRQTAGICGRTLVVNLPGRPKSIRQCLDAVFPAIPYCIDLIHTGNPSPPRLETNLERLVAFRPKG